LASLDGSGNTGSVCTSGCFVVDSTTDNYFTYTPHTFTDYKINCNGSLYGMHVDAEQEDSKSKNKKKTFKERLQKEIDEWCRDVLENEDD